ncbi:DsrE/DsrF-like family protein [Bremerella volcania]|uniref:DsrE/DsrF-like family protein n=1 Tax=Bremerella volcania TaxID=2527984 RepID=A0A518CC19_9BACT|nr:DsrE family protein [Bremerella volcania]QDU76768.1 DsrE/DsrF-like family protein [Bremerella volcania]
MAAISSRVVLLVLLSLVWCSSVDAQGFGRGRMGRGPGQGQGPGHGQDDQHEVDMEVFHYLLENHQKIRRTVKELDNGVETLTESDVPSVAAHIKTHVEQMTVRLEKPSPIRMRDPLFAEIFQHTKKIKIEHEDTPKGVKVIETSDDPYVAGLIKAHAKVVSLFVERGFAEAHKNHPVPGRQPAEQSGKTFPKINGHGGVFNLSNAAQQPRSGSKIAVDITQSSEPDQLNLAIEKAARFVNLYAGAGKEPATVEIALVFHGDATLAVLNDDAYKSTYQTEGNPNLELLRDLHHAGVQMYVCGQSLQGKGKSAADVAVFVDTAVSALTTNVNLQSDGYTYIPLGN